MARALRIGYARAVRMSGDATTFALSGSDAGLRPARTVGAEQGSYAVNGQYATLAVSDPFRVVRTGITYATLNGAINGAISGDTIKMKGGTYTVNTSSDPGNMRVTLNINTITIEAEDPVNNPAVIDMRGLLTAVPGDVLYVRGPNQNLTLRGIHLRGMRSGNNSAIWHFSGISENLANPCVLTVEYCKFQEFGNGILTSGSGATAAPNMTTNLRHSVFADCGSGDGLTHGIYIGVTGVLNVLGCTFKTTAAVDASFSHGHLLKSRAAVNNIYGSMFDPAAGSSSCMDFGNGGTVNVLGNIILHRGPGAGSGGIQPSIRYGHDQDLESGNFDGDRAYDGRVHQVFMAQNTFRRNTVGADWTFFDYGQGNTLGQGTYQMVDDSHGSITPTFTVRGNIVGADSVADDQFVALFGSANTNAGSSSAIADDGTFSGGLVGGANSDATYAWAGELTPPVARTDTYRGGTLGVPYALPATGAALAIGINNALSITPAPLSTAQWSGALFGGAFGGGALVESYSLFGAFVQAGSGGHQTTPNVGAAVFDFTDATWKRLDNSNGIAWRANDYTNAETSNSGSPSFVGDQQILAASPQGIPVPTHLFGNSFEMSAANGGGTKGSIALAGGSAGGTLSNLKFGWVYRMDLATGLWSKWSTNDSGVAEDWTAVAYDPTLNRIWHIKRSPASSGTTSYVNLGGSSGTWQMVTYSSVPNGTHFSNLACWDSQRYLLTHSSEGELWMFNINNPSGGWKKATMTGALLPGYSKLHLYPANGKFYTCNDSGTVYELTAPADPWNGTWVCATKSFAGPTLPSTGQPNDGGHSTRFFYVPAIQCLAWVPGGSNSVYIMRP